MEHSKDKTNSPEADLFAELRKTIELELGESGKTARIDQAFQPLTDGLGLESPPKDRIFEQLKVPEVERQSPPELPAESQPVVEEVTPDKPLDFVTFEEVNAKKTPPQLSERHRESQEMSRFLRRVERLKDNEGSGAAIGTASEAPPLPTTADVFPKVSWMRRVMAAMMDELFVLTLWLFSVAITLKIMTGAFVSPELTAILESTAFLKFVAIEFATLWVCYFLVTVGVLDYDLRNVGLGNSGELPSGVAGCRTVFEKCFEWP